MGKIDEQNAAALKAAGYDVKKSMEGDESAADYYDISETVQSADPNKARPVRVGDARVMPNRLSFLPPQTRVYETAGDMAVPRDSFLSPNLGESQGPTQEYLCENPEHKKPADAENWLAAGESEGVRPADFVAPRPSVLKRAAGLYSNIVNGQDGDGVSAADRFLGGK